MKEPKGKALKDTPWNVWYQDNFVCTNCEGPAGEEIPLHQEFDWAERHWVLPAVYRCEEGLLLDLCMEIEPEEIHRFMKKWDLQDDTEEEMDKNIHRKMKQESPFRMEVNPELWVNGQKLSLKDSCGTSWNPDFVRSNDPTRFILEHYDLDGFQAWMISRYRFPWTDKMETLEQLSVTLRREPQQMDGSTFTITAAGEQISFTSPVDGTWHTLTVESFEPVELPETTDNWFDGCKIPRYAREMTYTICPPILPDSLLLEDTADQDAAIDPEGGTRSICMGYGLDHPQENWLEDGSCQYAAGSALHHELAQSVNWQMIWKKSAPAPMTLELKIEQQQ